MSSPINNPSGGGALQGIGEKFSPDLFTGTGNFSVPIALPAGRNGFHPEIGLQYSTGSGNSPFGLGWNLSIPGVTRKTAKGVPQYDDQADTFILSGAEDLIPVLKMNIRYVTNGDNTAANNGAGIAPLAGENGVITQYRPRTEGLFARIYHLRSNKRNCWKVMSKNGLTSWYGSMEAATGDVSVISNPANRADIFAWKLTYTCDSFNNHILYQYSKDTVYEDNYHRWDQSYLSQICYVDYRDSNNETQYLVTVSLSYETRPDPHSDYKGGIEIRTVKRCNKISVYTHPTGGQILTRSYDFLYSDTQLPAAQQPYNGVSLLCRVMVTGYDGVKTESLPPLDFSYTYFQPKEQKFRNLTGNDMPLSSLANPGFELIDLFGSGLQDIVQVNGQVRYWRNLGYGTFDIPRLMNNAPVGYNLGDPAVQLIDADGDGRMDLMVNTPVVSGYFTNKYGASWDTKTFKKYKQAPTFDLSDPNVKMVDMTGDGITDAVKCDAAFEIFFNDRDQGWTSSKRVQLKQIQNFPNVNFSDPRVKWADMTGDGLQDVVLINAGSITYWPNMGYGNFGKPVQMTGSPRFPLMYDPARIQLGDIDGDGIADLLYVDSNSITFWINRSGNGWSEPFVINGTPQVTNLQGIRMTDILGNGISGVLYSFDAIANTQRNRWYYLDLTGGVKPYLLSQMNNNMGALTKIQYLSSTSYYLADQYGMSPFDPTSKRVYANRNPWQTTLPMPVQVVARTEVIDQLSGGKLSTEYIYHHGYWDGGEREYRGFGRVDQRDTETFTRYNSNGLHGNQQFNNVAIEHYSPPVETRNWFHSGPVGDEFGGWMEVDFSSEYWQGDPNILQQESATTQLIYSLPRQAQRDAYRAWRGSSMRSELYALDQQGPNGTYVAGMNGVPYTVSESCQGIRLETCPVATGEGDWLTAPALSIPKDTSGYIFFSFATASRTTQWERGNDPMTSFSFTPNCDAYGQPLQHLSAALPRGIQPPYSTGSTIILPEDGGGPILSTASTTSYAQVDTATQYMVDRTVRGINYEVIQQNNENVFTLKQRVFSDTLPQNANEAGIYNIIGCTLNYYDGDAFKGQAPGTIGAHGVLVRSQTLVFTNELINTAYGNTPVFFSDPGGPAPSNATVVAAGYPADFVNALQNGDTRLGYVYNIYNAQTAPYPTGWYATGGMTQYDFQAGTPNPVGLVAASKDIFNAWSSISYDAYQLLPVSARQYLNAYPDNSRSLQTSAQYDYRVMQARVVTDPNGNRAIFDFSPLGLLYQSGVIGKDTINLPYGGYTAEGDLISESIVAGQRVINYKPSVQLQYDFFAFVNQGNPVWVRTIQCEQHYRPTQSLTSPTITKAEYTDGFGRLIQTRTQAEDVIFGDPVFGSSGLPADQSARNQPAIGIQRAANAPMNVVVSGWKVYNNKGKVVEQYEPYFAIGFDLPPNFDENPGLGEKIVMYYDPRGHLIRTVNPDGSEQVVILGIPNTLSGITIGLLNVPAPTPITGIGGCYKPTPWESYTYDANDNAGRTNPGTSGAFLTHWNTPANNIVDALGRTVKTTTRLDNDMQDNEVTMKYVYDIRGNQLSVADPIHTQHVFISIYSIVNKVLKTIHIDGGTKYIITDASDKPIWATDAKGAQVFNCYDIVNRPRGFWAIDKFADTQTTGEIIDPTEKIALRQYTFYGDESWINQPLQNNLLGKVYQHFDEAGVSQISLYDFKNNPLQKTRKVISDSAVITAFDNIGTTGILGHRVDYTGIMPGAIPSFIDSTSYQTDIQYDALNRSSQITYPADYTDIVRKVVTPTYNNAGALQSITMDGIDYIGHIAYNAKGQKLLVAWANGVMMRFAYNNQTFRLTRVKAEKFTISSSNQYQYDYNSGTTRYDQVYSYDLAGNILSVNDQTPDSGITGNTEQLQRMFEYDALYRLIYADGREDAGAASNWYYDDPPLASSSTPNANNCRSYHQNYSYDKLGNIISLQHVASGNNFTRNYNYINNGANNQTANIKDGGGTLLADFSYDNNGNQITANSNRFYEYDFGDRMRCFYIEASGSLTQYTHYLYDSAGIRVKKLTWTGGGNFESVTYIDGIFEYRKKVTPSTTEEKNYLQIQGGVEVRIGAYRDDDGIDTLYTISDYLSSASIRIKDDGGVYDREEFYPYGDSSLRTVGRKRYRYTGKEKDSESGLYYYGARYYCSWTAKFMSVDPLAEKYNHQSSYCYADCNPVVKNDPTGMGAKDGKNSKSSSNNPTTRTKTTGTSYSWGTDSDHAAWNHTSGGGSYVQGPQNYVNHPPPPASHVAQQNNSSTSSSTNTTVVPNNNTPVVPAEANKSQSSVQTPTPQNGAPDSKSNSIAKPSTNSTSPQNTTSANTTSSSGKKTGGTTKSAENDSTAASWAGTYNGLHFVMHDTTQIRYGGTWAWENQNPGNMRPWNFKVEHGAIGINNNFYVFPDSLTGAHALMERLESRYYRDSTIASGIKRYAPPKDKNNPVTYAKHLSTFTGLKADSVIIKNLDSLQLGKLIKAITIEEGYAKGQIYTAGKAGNPGWVDSLFNVRKNH